MSKKLSEETIKEIREMRKKGFSQDFIRNTLTVSQAAVQKYTKDIKVDIKRLKPKLDKTKDAFPCITYPFSELSLEDQSKYNNWFAEGRGIYGLQSVL